MDDILQTITQNRLVVLEFPHLRENDMFLLVSDFVCRGSLHREMCSFLCKILVEAAGNIWHWQAEQTSQLQPTLWEHAYGSN